MQKIAVIPARGGSKRIYQKNIKPLFGVPIIVRTLRTIIKSKCFDQVIVSTDSQEIQNQICGFKECSIYRRSSDLSDDYTGTQIVVKDVCENWDIDNEDLVCCIYPTAVLLSVSILKASFLKHTSSSCKFTFAAKEYVHPFERSFFCENQKVVLPSNIQTSARTQDFKKRYHDTGYFYWGKSKYWKSMQPIIHDGNQAYILKQNEAWDIDTQDDWDLLEALWVSSND